MDRPDFSIWVIATRGVIQNFRYSVPDVTGVIELPREIGGLYDGENGDIFNGLRGSEKYLNI